VSRSSVAGGLMTDDVNRDVNGMVASFCGFRVVVMGAGAV